MITVRAWSQGGFLRRLEADGHAAKPEAGDSAACAAVSALLKAFAIVAVDRFDATGSAPAAGRLELAMRGVHERAAGAWTLCRATLLEIERAYPDQVVIHTTEE